MNVRPPRWAGLVAVLMLVLVSAAMTATFLWPIPGFTSGLDLVAIAWTLVGAILVARRPDHPVAWSTAATGLFLGTSSGAASTAVRLVEAGDRSLLPAVLGWWAEWTWVPFLFSMLVVTPLLLPTGRLPSPRWRPFAVFVAVWGTTFTAAAAGARTVLAEGLATPLDNPFGFLPFSDLDAVEAEGVILVLLAGLAISAIGALWSLVQRLRRGSPTEREQVLLVVIGATLTILGYVLGITLDIVGIDLGGLVESGLTIGLPLAVLVAVLRHRLLGIDQLVSRTLAWATVSVMLLAVYVGIVLAAQGLLGLESAPDVVVAGSTLAVAALVGPLRRRVQVVVDRRFNRRAADASARVSAFAGRVRDQVDLAELHDDLRSVAAAVVQPSTIQLWLRPEAPS